MTKECFLMEIEKRARVAVFASGTGGNFEAMMADDNREFEPVVLVCATPKARGIGTAAPYVVDALVLMHAPFPTKSDYEKEILTKLERLKVEWSQLAGYMRVVGETLFEAHKNRIVRDQPSILRSIPGT